MDERRTTWMSRMPAAVLVTSVVAAACSGGDNAGSEGFSVTGSLEQLPAAAIEDVESGDTVEIVVGDFVRATALAGVDRPSDPNDLDQTIDWLNPLTGFVRDGPRPDAFVFTPDVIGQRFSMDFEDFVDELGFGPSAIDTFAEVRALPDRFSVLTGDIAFPSGLPEVAPGVRTIGEGDDYEPALDGVTPLRSLGRPLRVAERDGTLGLSLSTPAVESWVSGEGASLADDGPFVSIAGALDEVGVVSAYLLDGSFFAPLSGDLLPTEDVDIDELIGAASGISPFTTVGIGWAVDDDGPLGVAVYRFGNDAVAAANVDAVRSAFEADSIVTQQPISETLQVVDVRAEDAVVVATYRFGDETPLITPVNMLFQRDVVFNHP